jgi:hypothetical protein
MAKKETQRVQEERTRQTRKEILLARKHERQMKRVRLAVGAVLALLLLVIVIGLVHEYLIVPTRPVAVVNGENITLSDWQERVRYERAQRIIFLEEQLEAFNGDVGIIQQFAGQLINDLRDPQGLGQTTLNVLVDEVLIRQAAEARGIVITDADVERELAESYNYFGGESPPPAPTPTQTVMPTPSLTPITGDVITETEVIPTATLGPTSTPLPTATPVSAESYQEQYQAQLDQLAVYGISESHYRAVVRAQIYRERLAELLAEEEGVPETAEHVSLYLIIYETEADANEGAAMIAEAGYLPVWNALRSDPPDPTAETQTLATEFVWRTQEDLLNNLGFTLANAAFELPLNTPSEILVEQFDEETVRYFLIQVSGREQRPLSEQALNTARQQYLAAFIDARRTGNVEITENWRGRTPTQPILDQKFLQPPTPAPPAAVPPGEGGQ